MESTFVLTISQFVTLTVFLIQTRNALGSQQLCEKLANARRMVAGVQLAISAFCKYDQDDKRFITMPDSTATSLRLYLMMLEYNQLILGCVYRRNPADEARLKILHQFFTATEPAYRFRAYISDSEGKGICGAEYLGSRDFPNKEREAIETLNSIAQRELDTSVPTTTTLNDQ
jgi:hypothetical protein